MTTTTAASQPTTAPAKTQAQLIYELQQRRKRLFTTQVTISWVILLAFLTFLFSGAEIGPLSTIQLDQAFMSEWAPFIIQGAWITLQVSVFSILLACVLALLAALGRLSNIAPIYALSTFYVSLIRGTPLYLQIFFFFLALPQLGIQLSGILAGVLALGLNYGAYMSETFRAGILSVGKGQREAAMALGMTPMQMMRRIVLPQALRFALPPMGNDFISMLKDSALVSATGFAQEILWRAQKAGRQNFRNLEALIIAAILYWIMTIIFTYFQARLEKYMARGDR
jgi:polar amino acid transport system permease protein